MRAAAIALLLLCAPGLVLAERAEIFRQTGAVLVYDTETADVEMEEEHLDALLVRLRADPAITTLEINSAGGSVWAGDRMAEVVIDFELDTHVNGACISSCVTLFLAGETRTMSRGSRIGFHQLWWDAGAIRRFYDSEREIENWDTPFDFAEWLYEDTQTEAYQRLSYMVARGVDPAFAIQTLKTPSSDTWVPWRPVLLAAGVLTE